VIPFIWLPADVEVVEAAMTFTFVIELIVFSSEMRGNSSICPLICEDLLFRSVLNLSGLFW
jgi:hypothetical protein